VVVGPHRTNGQSHIISDVALHADGSGEDLLKVPGGGTRRPTSVETLSNREQYVRFEGHAVFRFGVTRVIEMITETLRMRQWTASNIGLIIPHQANSRLLRSVATQGEIPEELFFQNLEECGNTSSASIPIALDEAARGGKIPKGKPVLLLGFGGGLTWSSTILEW
jgi:3-oxoacyl-[acyl-carrier-protein] synthase-3